MSIVPMLFGGYSGALGMRRSISIVPPGPPVYFFVDRFRLLLPDAGALLCLVCDNTCRPLCTMVDLTLGGSCRIWVDPSETLGLQAETIGSCLIGMASSGRRSMVVSTNLLQWTRGGLCAMLVTAYWPTTRASK